MSHESGKHQPSHRPAPAFISPESRIPLSIAVSGIGGAIVTTAAACALWYHMDAELQNKVSLPEFQGFAVQLQTDNPQLKVKIPGINPPAPDGLDAANPSTLSTSN